MDNLKKVVYINLERRNDRRRLFEAEMARMDMKAERFTAIEKTPGLLGCHLSHLQVLKQAREEGVANVLIFEDDFEFLVSKDVLQEQLHSFFASNIDYDVLMFSYKVEQSSPINNTVSRTTDVQTMSGYLVHKRFYNALIENLERNYLLLEATRAHWLYLNDQCWKSLQKDHVFLYFNTRLGKQRASYSDLSMVYIDYGV